MVQSEAQKKAKAKYYQNKKNNWFNILFKFLTTPSPYTRLLSYSQVFYNILERQLPK